MRDAASVHLQSQPSTTSEEGNRQRPSHSLAWGIKIPLSTKSEHYMPTRKRDLSGPSRKCRSEEGATGEHEAPV